MANTDTRNQPYHDGKGHKSARRKNIYSSHSQFVVLLRCVILSPGGCSDHDDILRIHRSRVTGM